MTNNNKLDALRNIMKDQGFDGFIIPRTDEYLGEYVPACAERLKWLTGFTGSAGAAVVLSDKAMVMSDGRYTIQLEAEVDGALYELENSQITPLADWMHDNVDEAHIIGYDAKLHTPDEIAKYEEAGITLKAVGANLIDKIWKDRPVAPVSNVTLFPFKFSGLSAEDKISNLQNLLKKEGADAALLTMSDSVAWLLNIRGDDIPFIPVTLSYAVVPVSGKVKWFLNLDKLNDDVKNALNNVVDFVEENKIADALRQMKGQKIWLDERRSSIYFKNILEQNDASILNKEDPCLMPRACKNEVEQNAMRDAHVRDGIALVKFLKWFDDEALNENLTELSVEEKLESFRGQAPEFKQPSFSTIAGYGANGAIVHYRATSQTSQTIKKGNLLLLDSGAQYCDGTTDITRTLAVGDVSDDMKQKNTLVLKGHIALARAQFKKGTTGKDLDKLARGPLQAKGLDYAHGTGHGVGCYLSVHEEAASISPRGERAVEEGMIISNEPGYYETDAFGIRIENLILTKAVDEDVLCFETITLAPIDKNLVVKDMLDDDEINWLNSYHDRVFKTLSPLLDDVHVAWLKDVTAEV